MVKSKTSSNPGRRPSASRQNTRSGRQIIGRPERRQAWVLGGFLLLLFVLGGRLVQVQALDGSDMAEEALSDRMSSSTLHAVRGDIVDANGVPIATSVERYDVVVDQTLIEKFKKTDGSRVVAEGPLDAAELMAPILDLDAEELALQLIGEKRWVRIARGITPEVWHQVRELRISGVSAERTEERIYPAGNVAGNIVGFLGSDGVALGGLELIQDERLTGTDGKRVFERDASRVAIPGGVERVDPAVPGETMHLTIERDLQWQIQEIVDDQKEKQQADYAVAIVQDVETGELLALADSGSVDPNDPAGTAADGRGSRAVSDVLEPGSTSKVITVAALLEEGKFTPDSRFSVPDRYTAANGESFKDATDHGVEKLTLTGILSRSSNVGTIMAGEKLSKQEVYDYMRAFGFGEKTGVGL
ncbi:MAG TPA: penicillin-binding transpeptidase domain-containing protein, partial [Actinomycetales bacterium]|nr:penicillin-binding transpeptidase domain-containing protein [Actinomycetales bacterium]